MRRVIRLGDRTSYGGYVVSATSRFTVMGIDVARLGDKCTCPKKGHNNCYIVEGDPNWTIDGVPVALEGHELSCGAVLISSMPNAGREDWCGGEVSLGHAPSTLTGSANALSDEDEGTVVIKGEAELRLVTWLNRDGASRLADTLDKQTRQLASMAYGEGSSDDDSDEMSAIASALVR